MAQLPIMPLMTDALLADTTHLTAAEFGAYCRMLIVAWRSPGCALPNDEAYLAKITRSKWSKVRGEVMKFWEPCDDGMLRQKKLTNVFQTASEQNQNRSRINSSNSLKGWEKRKRGAMPSHGNHKPLTIYEKQNAKNGSIWVGRTNPSWLSYADRWEQEKGSRPPEDRDGGWWFPNEWLTQ